MLLAPLALSASDHKPIVKDGYVMRTIQQDAELKDWITGMVRANAQASKETEAAEKSVAEAKTENVKLQVAINARAAQDAKDVKARDEAIAQAKKDKTLADTYAVRLSLICGALGLVAALVIAYGAFKGFGTLAAPWGFALPAGLSLLGGGGTFCLFRFLIWHLV